MSLSLRQRLLVLHVSPADVAALADLTQGLWQELSIAHNREADFETICRAVLLVESGINNTTLSGQARFSRALFSLMLDGKLQDSMEDLRLLHDLQRINVTINTFVEQFRLVVRDDVAILEAAKALAFAIYHLEG